MKISGMFDNIHLISFSWLISRGYISCNWIEWLKNPLLLSSSSCALLGVSSFASLYGSFVSLSFCFLFLGACLVLHQKYFGVKTGCLASARENFSIVSILL